MEPIAILISSFLIIGLVITAISTFFEPCEDLNYKQRKYKRR